MQKTFTDQLGRSVQIVHPPRRIISLVPSQTELLFDLGLADEVVGITKFCVHPKDKFRSKPKIGGTKKLNIDAVRKLGPDLIIGNKEENEKGQIELLMKERPVWMSDISTLEDSLEMISSVGDICAKQDAALQICENIKSGFKKLVTEGAGQKLRAAYLIWKDPYMAAGKGTFIDEMIGYAGWENAVAAIRYPELTAGELKAADPDIILLSSEPYPFTEKHIDGLQSICPRSVVKVVDGELFCWYGSRLQKTPAYLYSLMQQFDTLKSK